LDGPDFKISGDFKMVSWIFICKLSAYMIWYQWAVWLTGQILSMNYVDATATQFNKW